MRRTAALFALLLGPLSEPTVAVPRVTTAVVIDGQLGSAEWASAAQQRLADGTTLRFQHDGNHLFIGIAAARPGFASVCSGRGDSVRVLHASAALGSVHYSRVGDVWTTRDTAFVYGMRNADSTEQARQERRTYLARHGWVSSTFRMSQGLAHEMQVSLELLDRVPLLAIAYFVAGNADTWSILPWPASTGGQEGCVDAQLVRGYVPTRLSFETSTWAELRLEH